MLSVHSLEQLQLGRPAFAAIGAFDGVHRGHQALISGLVERAHAAGAAALIITFYPHPSVFLRGRRPSFYLSTPAEKARYLAALGVDALVTHAFDAAFAAITAEDYVDRLVRHARLAELVCGEDFALGHGRVGNVAYLRAAGERQGFRLNVHAPLRIDGEIISSTAIRQRLRDGAVEQAARALGRPFQITGEVVTGLQRGRTLGIPTANLALRAGLREATSAIEQGRPISVAFEATQVFPPLVIRMLRLGEHTGALDDALAKVASLYRRDVAEGIARLQAAAEPALTILMGGLLLWIASAILGPIYELITRLPV